MGGIIGREYGVLCDRRMNVKGKGVQDSSNTSTVIRCRETCVAKEAIENKLDVAELDDG